MSMTKASLLAEVRRRRRVLRGHDGTKVGDEDLLTRQLQELEQLLAKPGRIARAEWEEHQLHWGAHCAELQRSIICRGAHIAMVFEDMQRTQPDCFDNDPYVQRLMNWWLNKGGREDFLSQITIGERRELEEMERQWREEDL
jgi:hypothetical protein